MLLRSSRKSTFYSRKSPGISFCDEHPIPSILILACWKVFSWSNSTKERGRWRATTWSAVLDELYEVSPGLSTACGLPSRPDWTFDTCAGKMGLIFWVICNQTRTSLCLWRGPGLGVLDPKYHGYTSLCPCIHVVGLQNVATDRQRCRGYHARTSNKYFEFKVIKTLSMQYWREEELKVVWGPGWVQQQ